MGIQLASNRYSHRLDTSILQIRPVGAHFLPHLISIGLGVILLSLGEFGSFLFAFFIFSSITAVLSIFPFILWLLDSLTPKEAFRTTIDQIDEDYLNEVEEIVVDERENHLNSSSIEPGALFEEVTYSQTTENDPVDAVSDIVRSSIGEDDTGTAKRVLNDYVEQLKPAVTGRYREFRTTNSTSQLVCWYVYAPLEDLFRYAIKHENMVISMDIVSLLKDEIVLWHDEERDVPEVFFRTLGQVTTEYATDLNRGELYNVASEYSDIGDVIANDLRSPHTRISSAMKTEFENQCLSIAVQSIDQENYRSARVITHALRQIIESYLLIPSANPKRSLLIFGLIGEKFATEEAQSKSIVAVADEVSILDEAEWSITTLVTFLDKIDEYGNRYSSKPQHRELVVKEIGRINDALEPRDQEMASMVPERNSLVIDVIRASRFFRRPFTVRQILEQMERDTGIEKVKAICDAMVDEGLMQVSGKSEYTTTFRRE